MLGAGAVGTVSALKFVQEAMLEQLVIADAVSARASLLADRLKDPRVSASAARTPATEPQVTRTIRETGTTIVLNAALPATNLEVMRACLEAGCHYIDLASGGTDDDGIPKLDDQFALDAEFKAAGPHRPAWNGRRSRHHQRLRRLRREAPPRHGHRAAGCATATTPSARGTTASWRPSVPGSSSTSASARRCRSATGRYQLEDPLTGFEPFDFPELGVLNCYYVDHEESKTLPRFFPDARVVDFKLCMDDVTVETLRVMKRLGLSGKDPGPGRATRSSPRATSSYRCCRTPRIWRDG